MKELKSIKIKCKYYDRGCAYVNYYHEVPIHATTCEFEKKPVLQDKNINSIWKDPVDEDECDEIYNLINMYKNVSDVSNIRDEVLLQIISTHGLSKLTVENLKGLLLNRNLNIGFKTKEDLTDRLKAFLKKKYSDHYVNNRIISKDNYGNYKRDALKGLLVLKDFSSNSLEKKTRAECVDLLKNSSKI